jgi:hypothetical protein
MLDSIAQGWRSYKAWAERSVVGKVIEHSVGFVFIAALYRLTYEILHILLPPKSIWSIAIGFMEGLVITTIFVALSLEVIVIVCKRIMRSIGSHDLRSFGITIAF